MELSGSATIGAFTFVVETQDNVPANPANVTILDINGTVVATLIIGDLIEIRSPLIPIRRF